MTQVEVSKQRLFIENLIQQFLVERKELERKLFNVQSSIENENRKLDILMSDPDEYERMLRFDEEIENKVYQFLRRNKEIVRI